MCGFFGIKAQELKSSRRSRNVARPRMLAMFLARKLVRASYNEIGQYFGGRNHSTVVSAERTVREWMEEGTAIQVSADSWPLREVLDTLEQRLSAG